MTTRNDADDAEECVRQFERDISVVRSEILSQLPVACRSLLELIRHVNQRTLPAKFQLGSGAWYAKHGIGVRMVGSDGAVIDLDVRDDGIELFDAHRVVEYIESVGGSASIGAAERSLGCLTERGSLIRAGNGFYSFPLQPRSQQGVTSASQ